MISGTLQPDPVRMRMQQPCPITPRLIRLRHAPFYLGIDRNRFNAEVRPYLVEIRIGRQGVAFDRLDLDAWVDKYKARNGRSVRLRGELTWDAKQHRGSRNARASGISTNASAGGAFARAVEQVTSRKRNASSRD